MQMSFRRFASSAFLLCISFCRLSSLANADQVIETIAGTGLGADGGNGGSALRTNVGKPFGMAIGPDGALYFAEYGTHRVRRLDLKTGTLTNIAGTGQAGYSGDGGLATNAALHEPHELAFDRAGNLYVTDMRNSAIRKIDAKTGVINTVAGSGKPGFAGDGGPATSALLNQPHSLCIADSADGKTEFLYIADVANDRIRRVDLKSGQISTIAGNGKTELPQEGAAANDSTLRGPRAICTGRGSLWIVLREGNSVWRIDLSDSVLHHVAGTGKSGFAIAVGPAKDAQFASPKGVSMGPDGYLYVADSSNHVVRRIDPATGTISLVAGAPQTIGFAGDGDSPARSLLNNPHGILAAPNGTIYIGDSDNNRVRRIRQLP
jgi:DNA-binding beta-propeller fold protein YncE